MTPGDAVRFEMTKWGDRPHWQMSGLYLGTDRLGDWVGFPVGTPMSRPGAALVTTNPQVGLVPAAAVTPEGEAQRGWVATFHGPGGSVQTYVDMTTPPAWDISATPPTLRCVDLDLDVVKALDGTVHLDDEDEFAEHQLAFGYPPDVVALAERTAQAVLAGVTSGATPFDRSPERWLAELERFGSGAATVAAAGQSWSSYRDEVFGPAYEVWHDGADFAEIQRRYDADPALVRRLLLAGMADGDALAATAVRELRVDDEQRQDWVARLTEQLPASWGSLQVEIGTSLHALTGVPDAAPLLQVLGDLALHWGVRMDAARRLAGFPPTPELVEALAAAVRDPDYLVRFHSANTLLVWAGARSTDIAQYPDLFPQVAAEERPDLWESVAARLAGFVRLPDGSAEGAG